MGQPHTRDAEQVRVGGHDGARAQVADSCHRMQETVQVSRRNFNDGEIILKLLVEYQLSSTRFEREERDSEEIDAASALLLLRCFSICIFYVN